MSDDLSAPPEPAEPAHTPEMPPAAAETTPAAPPVESLESAAAEVLVEDLEPVASPAPVESTQSPVIESQIEPTVEPEKAAAPEQKPEQEPRRTAPSSQIDTSPEAARSKLRAARAKRTSIKQERMTRILVALADGKSLSNDDAQELLKVSHATATRYLRELVRQGLIRKSGRGRGIVYVLV